MSKTVKQLSYGEAPAKLKNEVDYVLAQADQHNYYATLIYNAYNAVFGLTEVVQTCSSCLRSRVKKLRDWRSNSKKTTAATKLSEEQVEAKVLELLEGAGVNADTQPHEALQAVRKLSAGNHHEQVLEELKKGETALQAKIDADNEEAQERAKRDAAVEGLGLTEDSSAEDITTAFNSLIAAEGTSAEAAKYYEALRDVNIQHLATSTVDKPHDLPNTSIELKDGSFLVFTPNEGEEFKDGARGLVLTGDGGNVKAGTYETKGGDFVKVQVGGKARFEVNLAS